MLNQRLRISRESSLNNVNILFFLQRLTYVYLLQMNEKELKGVYNMLQLLIRYTQIFQGTKRIK